MRFVYTRRGGPLLDWSGPTPPYPTRAGETRSLGDWYPDAPGGSTSSALRRYGGRLKPPGGAAIPYERDRRLGAWGHSEGYGGAFYNPAPKIPGMAGFMLPRPGAPEVVEGYESPQPGAAVIHLGGRSSASYPWDEKYPGQTSFGHDCTWDEAHRKAHAMMSGFIPEGAIHNYGQTTLSADPAPAPAPIGPWIRRGAALASVYHGMKRNNGSIMWGLLWGLAAYVAPINGLVVPVIGAVQGFAQPKMRSNPAKRFVKKSFRVRKRKPRRKSRLRTRRYRRTKRYYGARRTQRGY